MKLFLFSALLVSMSVGAQALGTGSATGTVTAPGSSGFSTNNGTSAPGNFTSPGTGTTDVTPATTTTNTIPSAGFNGNSSPTTSDVGMGGRPDPTTDTPTTVNPSVINTSPNPTPDSNASRTFDDTLSTGQGAPTRNTYDLGPYNNGTSDPVERQAEEERP